MGAFKHLCNGVIEENGYYNVEDIIYSLKAWDVDEIFSIEYHGNIFDFFDDFHEANEYAQNECDGDYWEICRYSRQGDKERYTVFSNLPPWEYDYYASEYIMANMGK